MLNRPPRADRHQARRERRRRYERRQRAGRIVVPVELGETVIAGLIAIGWLREGDSTDARRIGAAIEAMLADTFK
jgi:hypothetical protein